MPSRNDNTPRTQLPIIAGIALLLLLACLFFVTRPSSGGAHEAAGENVLSENKRHASSNAGADADRPSIPRKPRPASKAADGPPPLVRMMMEEPEQTEARAARVAKLESYLTTGYQLTPEFLTESRLAPEQFAAVQKVLDQEWTHMAEWAASHVIRDEAASAQIGGNVSIYRLPALDAGGMRERFDRLGDTLRNAVPDASPDTLTDIRDAIVQDFSFGRYGRADSEIRIFGPGTDLPDIRVPLTDRVGEESYRVRCSLRDPVSRSVCGEKESDLKTINRDYGNIFQLGE